jgi:hypothetical protein
MAQANFFQPGFDEQIEAQNIERQRQYAQLLRQKGDQAPQSQMVSGHYVAPSITQNLAQLLNAYQGGQGVRQADERQKALAEAVRGRQSEEMGQFTKLLGGEPARDIQPLTPNDDEGNAMPVAQKAAVPGDINAAYQYAASARTPGLQQMGTQGQLQMAQEQAKQAQAQAQQQRMMAVLQSAPGPQQAIAAGVPPEMVKQYYESRNYGRDEVTFQDVGGQKVPVTKFGDRPSGVAPLEMTGNPYKDLLVSDGKGGFMPNAPLVGVKSGIARAGASNVSVNTEKGYAGEIAKGLAASDLATIDAARAAGDRIRNAQSIKSYLDKNPITGTGAEARLALNKALTTAGIIDGKQVQNTETLAGLLASSTLDAIKTSGLGGGQGFTDKDRAFLERAKSGNLEVNASTLRDLADMNERAGRASISKGKAVADRLKNNPTMGTVGQEFNFDEPAAVTGAPDPASAKPMPQGNRVFNDADAILNRSKK